MSVTVVVGVPQAAAAMAREEAMSRRENANIVAESCVFLSLLWLLDAGAEESSRSSQAYIL